MKKIAILTSGESAKANQNLEKKENNTSNVLNLITKGLKDLSFPIKKTTLY